MLCGKLCLCGCTKYIKTRTWCLMNVMHSWFCDVSYIYILKHTFSLEFSVLLDLRSFRHLTFYNDLARQASSFCNFTSFCVA